MITSRFVQIYFYKRKWLQMKKIFFLTIGFCFFGLSNAQVKQKPVPPPVVKQTQIVKADSNSVKIQQPPTASTIKRILPATVTENLLFYKWKATRLGLNPLGEEKGTILLRILRLKQTGL